jgi:hypothetical protein
MPPAVTISAGELRVADLVRADANIGVYGRYETHRVTSWRENGDDPLLWPQAPDRRYCGPQIAVSRYQERGVVRVSNGIFHECDGNVYVGLFLLVSYPPGSALPAAPRPFLKSPLDTAHLRAVAR